MSAPDDGRLAIVLHTHMPYVESGGEWPHPRNPPHGPVWRGFGTWPFGEEWLWEAIATSYLPLLDVLARAPAITISLTPVLCDQLEAPGVGERLLAFLRDVRREIHRRDAAGLHAAGEARLAAEVERAAADYERAARRFEQLGGDLLAAFAPYVDWTSAATHAVLPLLATDAGIRLQLDSGIAAHRQRFGAWRGGLWLPECAWAPWLGPALRAAGVRTTCVDLSGLLGPDAFEQLIPMTIEDGPVLVPIDRATIELVWGERGYPAAAGYRDSHRRTHFGHKPWTNGGVPYDPAAARALARLHAQDFVARTRKRLRVASAALDRPALVVCALDTELLGHWWYEGVHWLEAVVEECGQQGLALTALDDALERCEPRPASTPAICSWGRGRDLRTWDGPDVAELAWRARAGELRVLAAGAAASPRALRELLALQSSDWAFAISYDLAREYGLARAIGHADALDEALRELDCREPRLRNLAPYCSAASLLRP